MLDHFTERQRNIVMNIAANGGGARLRKQSNVGQQQPYRQRKTLDGQTTWC
jgi:hypothetical protein